MNDGILFAERQRFRLVWIWIVLLSVNVLFLSGVYKQAIKGQQFGNQPLSDTSLIIAASLTLLLTMLFIVFRLDTEIRTDGIYVRFFPIQLKFKKYAWNQLLQSFVRKYNPIAEFGGWGLRLGLFGRGRACIVSGDKGIQLVFVNGSKLLIGTQKEDEAREALIKVGHLTE